MIFLSWTINKFVNATFISQLKQDKVPKALRNFTEVFMRFISYLFEFHSFSFFFNSLYTATKLLFVGAIFISYGLQFYVPLSFVWPPIRNRIPQERYHTLAEYIFRTIIVLITSKLLSFRTKCLKNDSGILSFFYRS